MKNPAERDSEARMPGDADDSELRREGRVQRGQDTVTMCQWLLQTCRGMTELLLESLKGKQGTDSGSVKKSASAT